MSENNNKISNISNAMQTIIKMKQTSIISLLFIDLNFLPSKKH